jgi:protein-disulfide isomerase
LGRVAEIESTLRRLESEVTKLATLLRAALPPGPIVDVTPPVEISIIQAPTRGAATAALALIEFSDFECPFCGRHAQTVYHELQSRFVDTGEVRYVFRHLPLDEIHPSALRAATAAECARAQGKFWEMHDQIFMNQRALAMSNLLDHARLLGLDLQQFQPCLQDSGVTTRIKQDQLEARRLGVSSTPTFFIGEIKSDGIVRVTKRIAGAQTFPVFQAALQGLISKSASQPAK